MNYAVIKKNDIANGPGIRVSLFVSGCRHRCENCFNREAWDFSFGKPYSDAVTDEICAALRPDYVAGLSLLGGEPFEPENRPELIRLCETVRACFPEKRIWCYTGFVFEALYSGSVPNPETAKALLRQTDVLVDGRFVESLKDPSLLFRGSSNQRILDVAASLKAGSPIWLPGVWKRQMGSGNIEEM